MAAGGVVALALIGCIIRTTSSWTKQTVAWAKGEKISERTEGESGEYTEGKEQDSKMMDTDSISGPVALFTTNTPAKFTGSHHMPSPQIHPVSDSISIFSSPSPLPSPRVMPYSQPNYQVSNSSLLNPFGRGAGIDTNSSVTIELSDRSLTPTKSYESLTASERSRPFAPEARGMETRAVTPEGVVSRSATAGTAGTAPYYPRSSRPQSPLSRDLGYERPGSNLHKSMSMQQLGSRPAPPPPRPGLHQALSGPIRLPSVPAIAITNTSHPRPATVIMTQADMQGPYLSLDSLIERTSININNDNQASSESSESSEPEIATAKEFIPSFIAKSAVSPAPTGGATPISDPIQQGSSNNINKSQSSQLSSSSSAVLNKQDRTPDISASAAKDLNTGSSSQPHHHQQQRQPPRQQSQKQQQNKRSDNSNNNNSSAPSSKDHQRPHTRQNKKPPVPNNNTLDHQQQQQGSIHHGDNEKPKSHRTNNNNSYNGNSQGGGRPLNKHHSHDQSEKQSFKANSNNNNINNTGTTASKPSSAASNHISSSKKSGGSSAATAATTGSGSGTGAGGKSNTTSSKSHANRSGSTSKSSSHGPRKGSTDHNGATSNAAGASAAASSPATGSTTSASTSAGSTVAAGTSSNIIPGMESTAFICLTDVIHPVRHVIKDGVSTTEQGSDAYLDWIVRSLKEHEEITLIGMEAAIPDIIALVLRAGNHGIGYQEVRTFTTQDGLGGNKSCLQFRMSRGQGYTALEKRPPRS
ncbi:hypothetical protein BGZ46_006635 [Entomortierella lignicola]|nr:hypothetical protein BGZ46_006635 [Entomortierella lignicola]